MLHGTKIVVTIILIRWKLIPHHKKLSPRVSRQSDEDLCHLQSYCRWNTPKELHYSRQLSFNLLSFARIHADFWSWCHEVTNSAKFLVNTSQTTSSTLQAIKLRITFFCYCKPRVGASFIYFWLSVPQFLCMGRQRSFKCCPHCAFIYKLSSPLVLHAHIQIVSGVVYNYNHKYECWKLYDYNSPSWQQSLHISWHFSLSTDYV